LTSSKSFVVARDGHGASSGSSGLSMLISNDATAQGFAIIKAVLDWTEVAELARTLETSDLDRSRAGARHLMNHPAVSAVAVDPRMVAIAGRFLGETAIPYKATLFDKSPARNWLVAWHQDTALPLCERREIPEWGPWSTKAGVIYALAPASALSQVVALRLHLDDSRRDNGPLRVLPGTHTFGLLTESDIARLTTEVPAVDCTVPAGGVVAMRPLIIHASSKGESDLPRRVLHIEYARSLDLGDGLKLHVA
jgi:ectoine hydroxylase-related dioxygenase (phytanoyl-CoA dioxygenase family)